MTLPSFFDNSSNLSGRPAHGRGLARQLKALTGIRHLCTVHLQDGHIPIYEVANIEVLPVRAENCPLRKGPTSTSPTLVTFLPSIFRTATLPLRV